VSEAARLLFEAAFHGDLAGIDSAVAAGADVDGVNEYGSGALYSACFGDQLASIDALLAHGADPNLRMTYRSPVDGRVEVGLVALMVCRSAGAVERLLAAGADPNLSDDHGTTPLMRVALTAGPDAVALLLKAGADRAAKDATGQTAADRVRKDLAWVETHWSSLRQPNATELRERCHSLLAVLGPDRR
jgi:ankyrin repeat protein